jgi:hypothetical protein
MQHLTMNMLLITLLPRTTAAGIWTKQNKSTVPVGLVGPVQLLTST